MTGPESQTVDYAAFGSKHNAQPHAMVVAVTAKRDSTISALSR